MNLFGMADASEVSDNPFEIAEGTYFSRCVDVVIKEKDDGNLLLKITWQIDEPDSEYHESKVSQYHTVVNKPYSEMEPSEKKSMKFYKMNLRRAFDLSETDMNTLTAQDILGAKAYVTIVINGEYTNISKVQSERLYKEENETTTKDMSSSFGI